MHEALVILRGALAEIVEAVSEVQVLGYAVSHSMYATVVGTLDLEKVIFPVQGEERVGGRTQKSVPGHETRLAKHYSKLCAQLSFAHLLVDGAVGQSEGLGSKIVGVKVGILPSPI